MPPLLAPFESQKVPFPLTLRVLWLQLLTPPNIGSRPRREASCPGKSKGVLDTLASLASPGHASLLPSFCTMLRFKGVVQVWPVCSLEWRSHRGFLSLRPADDSDGISQGDLGLGQVG